jgi:DNA-binding transcriptional LysR family regulator
MLNYELLRTFLAAGTAPTFTAAAASRHVTVSAISQQIRALEGQLGVPLFERAGRRVHVTPAGQALVAALRPAFVQIEAALEAALADHAVVRGLIALAAPRSFGRVWLRPRLAPLLHTHPELTFKLEFDVPSVLERRLVDGALDLVLLARPAELAGVVTQPLATETFVAVASPAYLRAHGIPRTRAEFQQHRFLVFDRDLAMHGPWWRAAFGGRAELPAKIVGEVASLEEMQALAEQGVALAVLPDYLVAEALAARLLVALPPEGGARRPRPAMNTLFLAWRASEITSARLRVTRDALLAR